MTLPKDARSYFEPCGKRGFAVCTIAYYIWYSLPFLLMIIGTCGNILSILVLSRRRLRQISTSVYLLFLTCTDMTVIWTAILRETLLSVFRFNIHTVSDFHCAATYFFMSSASSSSNWMLVLLTIERFIFTKFPLFAKRRMTRKTALILSATVILVMAITNGHVLFGMRIRELRSDTNITIIKCIATGENYPHFVTKLWPVYRLVAFSIIPMILIFSGNFMILYVLRQQKRKVMAHNQDQQNTGQTTDKSGREARATRLLFILCFFFLVTTTPFMIYSIVYNNIYQDLDDWQFAGIQLSYVIIKIFIWSNYTFNFFFYFISGSLFKREWTRMVREARARVYRCLGMKVEDSVPVGVSTLAVPDVSVTMETRAR